MYLNQHNPLYFQKQREALSDLEARLQNSPLPTSGGVGSGVGSEEQEAQVREMLILKKTVEELEMRIDSQKQTLDARDESIKKLLEMLHNKGVNVSKVITSIENIYLFKRNS